MSQHGMSASELFEELKPGFDSDGQVQLIACILRIEKGIKNVLAVDERTTRMLGEKPENLEDFIKVRTNK